MSYPESLGPHRWRQLRSQVVSLSPPGMRPEHDVDGLR